LTEEQLSDGHNFYYEMRKVPYQFNAVEDISSYNGEQRPAQYSHVAVAALLVLLALLALVQLLEASARIVDSSELHGGSIHSRRVAAAAAAELFAEGHLGDADAGVGAGEQAEEADQDSDEGAENEMPPAVPAPAPDHVQNVVQEMEPEQTWESRYRHGVAPAKLPALETDNAHGYRHSIIHPYGADLHA
ncbi:Glutamyl-tRNA reductase, partial [Frankliniella fusca]